MFSTCHNNMIMMSYWSTSILSTCLYRTREGETVEPPPALQLTPETEGRARDCPVYRLQNQLSGDTCANGINNAHCTLTCIVPSPEGVRAEAAASHRLLHQAGGEGGRRYWTDCTDLMVTIRCTAGVQVYLTVLQVYFTVMQVYRCTLMSY